MNATPINLGAMVIFDGYHKSSVYERFQRLEVDPVTVGFHSSNVAAGGAWRAFSASTYGLLVDGVLVDSVAVTAGVQSYAEFAVPVLAPGWHRLDIVGALGETCPTWFIFIGNIAQMMMPVFDGSYGITHSIGSNAIPAAAQHWSMVPAVYAPTPRPLAPRAFEAFSTALPPTQLYRRLLVPVTQGDIHRPNVNKDGIRNTLNRQAYFFGDTSPMLPGSWGAFTSKLPSVHLLDGPRGVGMVSMVSHIESGGTHGGNWYCTPWSFAHISGDGTIKTMIGYRSKALPGHWEDTPDLDLLGDWSAIVALGLPVGFHELWGFAWWKRTLALDMNAPPINGEQPHKVGPQAFFANTQNDRVDRATWSATDRSLPAKMTLFAKGKDAFDVVETGDKVYISFRGEHRIAEHDPETGAFLRDVAKGRALAHLDSNRAVVRDASLAEIQAEDCVLPEGLGILDGWLYFGSVAMAQLKRVNLTTGVFEVVCAPTVDINSHFMKFSISDGSFGPRGTVFVSTWSNNYYGHPQAFKPDGTVWNWFNYGPFSCGKGGRWDVLGYSIASGVGGGKLLCCASSEGIAEYSKALPTDLAKDEAKYVAGRNQFWGDGDALEHGELGCFGPFGLPMPMGDSPAKDYFINWNLNNGEALPPPSDCAGVIAQRDAALRKIANFKAALNAI